METTYNDKYVELEHKIEQMIDDLKGLCQTNGLANEASEETVMTTVFLYKFLNDQFMANAAAYAKDFDCTVEEMTNDIEADEFGFYDAHPQNVAFQYQDTIEKLAQMVNDEEFYLLFDAALKRIASYPENVKFGIKLAEGKIKPLFEPISGLVEEGNKNNFVKNIFGYITSDKYDFSEAFVGKFDFFSRIFEYLIKDYNVASGVYAEYFTPQAISKIIAKILVNMSPVEDKLYEIYDPSAGSGSLVLHLANELGKGSFGDKAIVYTQDISNKSTRFLRINMVLNGLTSSLENIIQGDTLVRPAHYNIKGDKDSGCKRFDFITSNPPFNMDFSSTRDKIEKFWDDTDRFFAGVPKILDQKKDSMPIYLCFIQHILWSLKDNGKAAIVVPTSFLTKNQFIINSVREKLVNKKWLKGVISMPPHIFANTGTNVSVLFIDKGNTTDEVCLVDATKLGKKIKVGKSQRVVLNQTEISLIEDSFINKCKKEKFSVLVSYEDIVNKGYSLAASQYFSIEMKNATLSYVEFEQYISDKINNINSNIEIGNNLSYEITTKLRELIYEQ